MPFLGKRIKYFGVFTIIVIALTIGGVLFESLGPFTNSAGKMIKRIICFIIHSMNSTKTFLISIIIQCVLCGDGDNRFSS